MAVTKEEEFRAWLETQPREVCVAIAYRAAMRVLPFALDLNGSKVVENRALMAIRAALLSGAASAMPSKNLRLAAYNAYSKIAADPSTNHSANDPAVAALCAAAFSAAAAYAGKDVVVQAIRHAILPSATAYSAVLDDLLRDASALADKSIPLTSEMRDVLSDYHRKGAPALEAGGPWTFWAKWYARAMAGDPLPWDLQEAVALIPDDIWEAGQEAVAAEIARIEAEYIAGSVAEEVVLSERGRLTLVPQPVREANHLGYLLETVDDALDLAISARNELTEESYQARLIRRTLSRYANDPQRMEINFERAKVSLVEGIAADDLPASPANRDLIQSLSDAAGSIRESNPDVARNRERLNRIRLGEITPDQARQIAEVAEAVADISEDVLKDELHEGIGRLPGVRRDDPVPDPVIPFPTAERNIAFEQKDAQVILFSRLTKSWLYLRSFDREELGRLMDTPEAKLVGLLGGLAGIVGLIALIVQL